MANRRVPKFSLNSCAQSFKMFMCPKFRTYPVLKHTKCHISTNLSHFLKLCLLYCQKLFALAPTNRRFAERNWLSGNTGLRLSRLLSNMTIGSNFLSKQIFVSEYFRAECCCKILEPD